MRLLLLLLCAVDASIYVLSALIDGQSMVRDLMGSTDRVEISGVYGNCTSLEDSTGGRVFRGVCVVRTTITGGLESLSFARRFMIFDFALVPDDIEGCQIKTEVSIPFHVKDCRPLRSTSMILDCRRIASASTDAA